MHVDDNSSSMEGSPGLHISPGDHGDHGDHGEHSEGAHSPGPISPSRRPISVRRTSSHPVNLTVGKNYRRNSVDEKHTHHDDDFDRVCICIYCVI